MLINSLIPRGKGNALEFVQNELSAMRERQEGGRNVKIISEMSTEEQLNARRKGISQRSKVKTGDVEKENEERKKNVDNMGEEFAEMLVKGAFESKEFLELAGKLGEANDEDIDRYIASQENYYFQWKIFLDQMLRKPAGTKLNLDFTFGLPGMPEMTVTEKINTESKRMRTYHGPTFDRECPNFCDEYCRTAGIPEGLDREWARKLLYRGFVDVRLLPWSMLLPWRMVAEEGTRYAVCSANVGMRHVFESFERL